MAIGYKITTATLADWDKICRRVPDTSIRSVVIRSTAYGLESMSRQGGCTMVLSQATSVHCTQGFPMGRSRTDQGSLMATR